MNDETVVWTPGTVPRDPYEVSGPLMINSGGKLILVEGTQLEFASGQAITVCGGELDVRGADGNSVVLFAPEIPVTLWGGIVVGGVVGGVGCDPSSATIEFVTIKDASDGIQATGSNTTLILRESHVTKIGSSGTGILIDDGATGTIENNTLDFSDGNGIGISLSAPSVTTSVLGNVVRNFGTGLQLLGGSPPVDGNRIQQCLTAVHISGASFPLMTNNIIGPNTYWGVYIDRGDSFSVSIPPNPVMRNNSLTGNPFGNLQYDNGIENIELDARENYWGDDDPAIAILTIGQDPNAIVFLTLPFLDIDGLPISIDGRTVVYGTVSTPTTWSDPAGYAIDGTLTVTNGAMLTIGPGVSVDLTNGQSERAIRIEDGTLSAIGMDLQRIEFIATPGMEWDGIHVGPGSSIVFDYVDVKNTQSGALTIFDTEPGDIVQITNSMFTDSFGGAAISLDNVANATIDNVVIDTPSQPSSATTIGIEIIDSSPVIMNSIIGNVATGISATGSSDFVIGSMNSFTNTIRTAISVIGNGNLGEIADNTINTSWRVDAGFGIEIVDSSPYIHGNSITAFETGIKIAQDSHPTITNNTIAGNIFGVWLEGSGGFGGGLDPNPIITGNTIESNIGTLSANNPHPCLKVGKNLCTSNYQFESPLQIDATGNYWGATTELAIIGTILAQSDNSVVIDISLYLDEVNGNPVSMDPTYSFVLKSVVSTPSTISPTYGDTATISFDLLVDANVKIELYIESDDSYSPTAPVGDLVKTEDLGSLSAGAHSWIWDGRDDSEAYVGDEAYRYVITATRGTPPDPQLPSSVFNPPRPPDERTSTAAGHEFTQMYDAFKNESYIMSIDSTVPVGKSGAGGSRVRWRVDEYASGPEIRGWKERVLPIRDDNLFVYDGRADSGVIFDGNLNNWFFWAVPISVGRNSIIVENTKPTPRNPNYDVSTSPPQIEVKSDPYLIHPSYEQFTTIAYKLDQDATVTMKILKPGSGNPGSMPDDVVAIIYDEEAQTAGTIYPATWVPRDSMGRLVKEEGVFTFWIRAEITGQPSLYSEYRGVIQVHP